MQGEIARRPAWAPLRVLAIVTGLFLVRGLLGLLARYCLGLRRVATARWDGVSLSLDTEWSVFGRVVRRQKTLARLADLRAVRFENRKRYVYLLVGFGALAIGTWIGIQWLVDGLRAGYPYLALIGAGVIALGVAVDLCLYLLVPAGRDASRLLIVVGPWCTVLTGVDPGAAERLLGAIRGAFGSLTAQRR
ncbi:MAG: hypothetical protein PHU25_01825 [Deltaproteobacteria bacterium]|nr:hypothetical protein [Deltaproteobacteria bacterium]